MKRRSVFIDMRYLSYLTNGFGQLCLYYGNYFLQNPIKYKDLDITLLVPKAFVGKFGSHVKYLEVSKKYKFFPFLLPYCNIYHSITQQIRYTSLSSRVYRILTIHDLNFLYEKNSSKAKRRLERAQARVNLVDLITVISQFTSSEISTHLNTGNIPVKLNYVGLRDITKDAEFKPYFIETDRKFFFTIGQVLEKKNFHVLLDMMKLMPEYDLYISGDNTTAYGAQIESRIVSENITNVFVTGPISHEEKIWMHKYCHAFVFPSKFEGFGAPVIEAMRFDKPVFSSRLTSLNEIGDKYAFFWDDFEPEYMKQVMVAHMDSFYENMEFRENQKTYAFFFTIDRHMENYLDIYRSVSLKTKYKLLDTLKNYINFMKA